MKRFYRNPKDFWTGIIYLAIGAGAIWIAGDYEMGTARRMGPAYFPVLVSIILVAIGTISLIRSFLKSGEPITGFAGRGLILVIGATVLFAFLVRGAGVIVALPLMIIVSAYASHHFRWGSTLLLALGLTVFCVLVFLHGLGVRLPLFGAWWFPR